MVDVSKLAKKPFKKMTPCFHGGNVWELSQNCKIPVEQIIDFSVSTNPLGAPKTALDIMEKNLECVEHYPDPTHEWLLQDIAKSLDVFTENIVIGNGSTELIYLFGEIFLDEKTDAILPVPFFSEYKAVINRFGANMLFLDCIPERGFQLDFNELEKLVSKKTRVIFLCNPNSPTGVLYKSKDLLEIVKFAAQRNVFVFVDEDYIDFVDNSKQHSMAKYVNEYNNLFVLRSLTKFFGLAGIRIGFGVGSPGLIRILKNCKLPWSVNSLAMFATSAAIKDTEYIKKSRNLISKSRTEMVDLFSSISWLKVHPSETNFLLVEIMDTSLTSTKLKEELAKKGLLIRDCKDFDGLNNKFFRVSVRKPEENQKLINQIKSIGNKN
ncbi:MAG: threonine-phosphate decarboxylase CobD [Candidatus Bathyarchaeota archaeon]|nr:threonine-phosphate decarboxylase CobD [Candidatus Bathyarchaeum tardum]WGM90016.1 MAG: threonine-phosphate decarboxylase CobD [Candidatus Bathyarchaeum tardum]